MQRQREAPETVLSAAILTAKGPESHILSCISPRIRRQQLTNGCVLQINIAFRDHCAHKLVDLNECRRENYYLPWTCQHEKHSYEKCQYKECD